MIPGAHMKLWLPILVVFGVLLFGIANTSSAVTITDLPMVNVDWNPSIDFGNSDLMGPLLTFIGDRLDLSSPFELDVQRPRRVIRRIRRRIRRERRHSAAPEPATWLLIGSGVAGLVLLRKKFKN